MKKRDLEIKKKTNVCLSWDIDFNDGNYNCRDFVRRCHNWIYHR